MHRTLALALVFLGVAVCVPVSERTPAPLTVTTNTGRVVGTYDEQNQARAFYGIPYSAPPVGENRFREPQAAESWNNTRDCSNSSFVKSHLCAQLVSVLGKYIGDEDCLYLNVYTPNPLPAEPLPVMVWIYGGAFVLGDSNQLELYDGSVLAQSRNVIVVTLNYRLVSFGFLAHEALCQEDNNSACGNYALLDQRFALQWVQKNIGAFGGDPSKVTIFGESAGGFSVCWHLASPGSKGLFRAAIIESGSCASREFFLRREIGLSFGRNWTRQAGCDDEKLGKDEFLSCIRALPASALMANKLPRHNREGVPPNYPLMPWGPVITGSDNTLPDLPINMITKGEFNKVPLIIGTNGDEGTIFIASFSLVTDVSPLLTDGDVKKIFAHYFNDTAVELLLKMYPKSGITNVPRIAQFIRDWFFLCPTRHAARATSSAGVPTFLYQFRYPRVEGYRLWGDYHAAELPYVFGTRVGNILPIFTKDDHKVSDTIQRYWTNLAANLNPNDGSKPDVQWPAYEQASDDNLILDVTPSINHALASSLCDFWDTLYTKN